MRWSSTHDLLHSKQTLSLEPRSSRETAVRVRARGYRCLPVTVFADSFADDLARRVASIVLESLPASAPRSPWLNVERAAEYLDTTPDAIRGMVKRGQVAVHRSSTGRLLFRREDLDAHAMGEAAA